MEEKIKYEGTTNGHQSGNVYNAEGLAPTLNACDYKSPIKICNYGNGHHAKDVFDPKGVSPTITTGNHGLGQTIAIKNATSKGYLEAENGDGIDISGRMEYHRGTVQKGMSQTITRAGGGERGGGYP